MDEDSAGPTFCMVDSGFGQAKTNHYRAIHGRIFNRHGRGTAQREDNEFQHSHVMMKSSREFNICRLALQDKRRADRSCNQTGDVRNRRRVERDIISHLYSDGDIEARPTCVHHLPLQHSTRSLSAR